jgi:hypothetical protein
VLTLLEERAVDLCSEAPVDALRQLYENVRDRAAAPGRDTPATAARLQLAALATCTQLLIKLEMPQRDARLVKVHVEMLFRLMERSGPYSTAPPELCRCAATCLRCSARRERVCFVCVCVGGGGVGMHSPVYPACARVKG